MVAGLIYFRLEVAISWVNMGILNGPRISNDHIRKVRSLYMAFPLLLKFYSSNDGES
jgi:hypothetical protein